MALGSVLPPALHMNLLLLLGLAIFGGTVGARLFKRIRFPQVVGYIVIGVLLGQSGLGWLDDTTVKTLQPFNFFALGIIGFMIGGELKADVFRRYGRQFMTIMLSEGLGAFFVVAAAVTGLWYLQHGLAESLALGVVLGAIASATAPAATVDVLWENRAGGPLTTCVLAIVALDDGLALVLYGLAASVADMLLGHAGGAGEAILRPLFEIVGAVALGAAAGAVLSFLMRRLRDRDNVLTFTIGTVFLVIGATIIFDIDLILAAMCLGLTLANLAPRRSQSAFELVEKFAPPIYVLFFVLVGARLTVAHMTLWTLLLVVAYVGGRTGGKMLGARWGARRAGAAETVRRYLGLCLFSQAGVAIGLSILASQHFGGDAGDADAIGTAIIVVVTASTFIVQILGPPCVKLAVHRAGEAGMNITEEDLIASYKVDDVMERRPVTIYEELPVAKVLEVFSEHDFLCYPVVDDEERLVGLISFQDIKDTLSRSDLHMLLLAHDLMEEIHEDVRPDAPLQETLERMAMMQADHLPVLAADGSGKLVGFLDRQRIMRAVATELIRRRRKAEGE